MSKRFYDTDWWKNMVISIVGTVVGIVLTFGTTFYIEKKDKEKMVRKTVVITLHNLDAKINNLNSSLEWMKHADSLFQAVARRIPDHLSEVAEDTLLAAYDAFTYRNVSVSESIAENVFSNSIEIWEYVDDEHIIGRISNCYSFCGFCTETLDKMQQERAAVYEGYLKQIKVIRRTPEAVRQFFQRPELGYQMALHVLYTQMIDRTLKVVNQMHKRNKIELGISQEELDAAGDLLTDEDYKELTDS